MNMIHAFLDHYITVGDGAAAILVFVVVIGSAWAYMEWKELS